VIGCQVAIVGAGITGCLTAIQLADSGFEVVLMDRAGEAMSSTSRWNEGKIHLGYCYLGDPTLATARLMLDGAAGFVEGIERSTGRRLRNEWFSEPVIYVVDPDSQFPVDELWGRSRQLAGILAERARSESGLRRYADGPSVLSCLQPDAAAQATGLGRISAAWRTSERCIAPGPVAALIREAVAERRIPLVTATARRISSEGKGWVVEAEPESFSARAVVNASWESRTLLDRDVAEAPGPRSIRYKYALFGKGLKSIRRLAPSTRIIGRFGDVTPYGNGEAYLSWYPAGLAGLSDDGTPPEHVEPSLATLKAQTLAGLGLSPEVLEAAQASWEVRGGYVIAHGSGDIDRPSSLLHYRDRFGAFELAPGYVSVDTGKYSCGPMLASRAAALVGRRIARPS
jgi:hypothetical protein